LIQNRPGLETIPAACQRVFGLLVNDYLGLPSQTNRYICMVYLQSPKFRILDSEVPIQE